MAYSSSWKRMKKVFSWGKKNRNSQPPPPTSYNDELTSSPGNMPVFSSPQNKTVLIFALASRLLVYLRYCITEI